MSIVKALVAGLALGTVTLVGTGFICAAILGASHGHREGAADMAGFFVFGPIGGVAGFLGGVGLVLRFAGQASRAKGVLIAGGCVFALQAALLAWTTAPEPRPLVFPQVLEFELEMDEADWGPGEVQDDARWTYSPDSTPADLISPLWGRRCAEGRCVVQSMAALNAYRPKPAILVRVHKKRREFPIALPEHITSPLDWSPWQAVADMRLRYRVVLNH